MTPHLIPSHASDYAHKQATLTLDRRLVRDRCDALRLVVLRANRPCLPWHCRLPLQAHLLALFLGLTPLRRILLHAREELITRARMSDMLLADVDALLDVPVTDLLVEDDADSARGDIVDDASLAVVNLVGL